MGKKKNCDCLFCNSKCPECGSTDIEVKCGAEFTFKNDTEDSISIDQEWGRIQLYCESCGLETDSRNPKYRKLGALQSAIVRSLGIPAFISFEHKEGGKIEATPYYIGPVN